MIASVTVMPEFIRVCASGRRRIRSGDDRAWFCGTSVPTYAVTSSLASTNVYPRVDEVPVDTSNKIRVYLGGPIVFSSVSLTTGLTYYVAVGSQGTDLLPVGVVDPKVMCYISFVSDVTQVSQPLAIHMPDNLLLEF